MRAVEDVLVGLRLVARGTESGLMVYWAETTVARMAEAARMKPRMMSDG